MIRKSLFCPYVITSVMPPVISDKLFLNVPITQKLPVIFPLDQQRLAHLDKIGIIGFDRLDQFRPVFERLLKPARCHCQQNFDRNFSEIPLRVRSSARMTIYEPAGNS